MKAWTCTCLIAAACAWTAAADERLGTVTLEQLEAASMPAGVVLEATLADGEAVATVRNTQAGAVSVQLAEIPLGLSRAMHLSYEAEISSEAVAGQAYLEMWAVVKGQAYFSRALNDPFQGDQPARRSSTPFFLKADEPVDAARLGVRFEGPGTITIARMALWDRGTGPLFGFQPGTVGGATGAAVGILSGIWGCLTSYLVARGRARGFVLGLSAVVATAGLLSLAGGAAAWMLGTEWELCYTAGLLGAIVTPIYGGMYFTFRARYQQAEQRRMLAMDMH